MKTECLLPKDRLAKLVLLLSIAFFAVVLWYPIIQTFIWSFQKRFMFQAEWVGLDNFRRLFTDDPIFINSIKVSFTYALMVVPGVVVLGLILAVLINSIKNVTLRGYFTASYFIAYVVPLVAVAIVWRYMFEPSRLGLFNSILGLFHLGPIRWLDSTRTALAPLAIDGLCTTIGDARVI